MSTYRMATLAGALVFLALAALALYRLLVGFPIMIGGVAVGQVATFFVLVASAALSLLLFRGSGSNVAR
jgi:hypothetical protein